jgi:hypothetical protein
MDNWHRSSCRGKSFVDAMLALEILQAYFAAVQVTLFHDLEIHDLTPLGRLLTQDLFEVGLINMVPLTWISPTPSLTGHHCLLGCNVRTRNYSICSPLKAASVAGRAIFDEGLAPRNGSYPQYHSGDISTLHASSFRRRWPEERAFHFANLRKSPGFHLLAQGADPLPPVPSANGAYYELELVKDKRDQVLHQWTVVVHVRRHENKYGTSCSGRSHRLPADAATHRAIPKSRGVVVVSKDTV